MLTTEDIRLKDLLTEIFLMEEEDYMSENGPGEIEGWDSLSMISVAVAIQEMFGPHMTPAEVASIRTIGDIQNFLRTNGVEI